MNYDLFGAGGDVKNEILSQRIVSVLRDMGPLSKADIAMAVNQGTVVVQQYLDNLEESGKVRKAYDGRRYELAHGGYYDGPGGEAA